MSEDFLYGAVAFAMAYAGLLLLGISGVISSMVRGRREQKRKDEEKEKWWCWHCGFWDDIGVEKDVKIPKNFRTIPIEKLREKGKR